MIKPGSKIIFIRVILVAACIIAGLYTAVFELAEVYKTGKPVSGLNARWITTIAFALLLITLTSLAWSFRVFWAASKTANEEKEQELIDSNEKYKNIVEAVPEGIWLLNENNKTVFINSTFTQMLGYDFDKAAEITPYDFIINSERRKGAEENVKKGAKENFESAFIGNNERAIWISIEINPIIKQNTYKGSLVITSDISKRKRAELLLAAENRVMEKIALNQPLHHILETIVLNVESSIEGGYCSILLLESDGKTFIHGAAPHLPTAFVASINGLKIGDGQGSCGTAAFLKKTVIVTDIATDPLWEKYKMMALPYGLKACWSTPIIAENDKVLGTFAVYYNKPQHPRQSDFDAIQRATSQTRIAIEKNAASLALLESEEKYRTLAEQASDAIFISDTEGNFITVNSSAARLTQYTAQEMLQKKFTDFTLPDDIEKNPFHFDELKQGKTVVTERRMKRKDGHLVDIEVTAKLIPDERILVFIRDISDRKKSEKFIKDSEARYRAFYENSMDGILLGAPDGSIYAANPAACAIYGCTEAEICLLGRKGVSVDDDAGMKEFLEERLKKGYSRKEVIQKKKNGELFPAELSSSVFTDTQGNKRTVIIIRDISNRVKAKNEILREKNLSDSIINSLPGVFYLCSYQGKFLRWNKNFETNTGYAADEIEKMHPLDFFSSEQKMEAAEKIKNVFITGEEKTEFTVITKSGERFPYFLSGKLIDYEGSPCFLGIGFDISDRLKAQEEIKQTNEQLRLLTSHLHQVREDERKRIAREIHDELGQQLTAMKMDVAWVDKKIAEENDLIKNKLKNILQLLDASNLSIRQILKELRMGVLEDNGLIEALLWLGQQFASTGINVTFSSTESILKVDENIAISVFRIYQEALTNITKHAAAKNVHASLSFEDGWLCLKVKDDGIGFDTESIKNKTSFGLLGIRERVASLKGIFNISSSPGNGTESIVQIPV